MCYGVVVLHVDLLMLFGVIVLLLLLLFCHVSDDPVSIHDDDTCKVVVFAAADRLVLLRLIWPLNLLFWMLSVFSGRTVLEPQGIPTPTRVERTDSH